MNRANIGAMSLVEAKHIARYLGSHDEHV